jgi:hypothetical protein
MLNLHYSDVFFLSVVATPAYPAGAEISPGRATSLIRAIISSHPTGGGSGLPLSLRSFASPSLGFGAPLLATLAGVDRRRFAPRRATPRPIEKKALSQIGQSRQTKRGGTHRSVGAENRAVKTHKGVGGSRSVL